MKYHVKEVEEITTVWEVEAGSADEAETIVNEGRGSKIVSKDSDGNMRSVETMFVIS